MLVGCAAPVKPAPLPPIAIPRDVERPLVIAPLPSTIPDRLPHTFEPASYAARLEVDPERPTFNGTIEITGTLAEPSALIWINAEDLRLERATASRGETKVRLDARYSTKLGWVALRSEQPLDAGAWTIALTYSGLWKTDRAWGGFRQEVGGRVYAFTQFEPDYARMVFPCFDEPDRKVPWQLTLEVPKDLVAASNTPIENETHAKSTKIVRFAPTKPLPSYLVAFAVGPFDVVEAGTSKSGVPIRILTQKGDAAKTGHATAMTARLLDRIESWLGVPFPYPKLDIVIVPKTAQWWAAMENPGLITIQREALGRPDYWDEIATHEIAHHWFGDLVTLAWWDDIWLNESFAYWIADKLSPGVRYPATSTEEPLIASPALSPRRHVGASMRIRPSGVEKGRRLLPLIEQALGEQELVRVLRSYLSAHAHGSVTTDDLRASLAEARPWLGVALDRYARWPSAPATEYSIECSESSKRVKFAGLGTTSIACIAYDDGTRRDRCEVLTQSAPAIELDTKHCPRWVLPKLVEDVAWKTSDVEALRDVAWSTLTSTERVRLVIEMLARDPSNGRLRLSLIDKIAGEADQTVLSWITVFLANNDLHIAPSMRATYNAWLVRLFGERARKLGIAGTDHDPELREPLYWLRSLVLSAGDKQLVQDALALLPKLDELDGPTRVLVLRAMIVDKPSAAEDLITQLATAKKERVGDILFALGAARDLLDLMKRHVASLARLDGGQKRRLFGLLCDESRRAEVEQLGRDLFTKWDDHLMRDFDWCVSERKRLEPELKAFFAPAGTAAKPKPLRR